MFFHQGFYITLYNATCWVCFWLLWGFQWQKKTWINIIMKMRFTGLQAEMVLQAWNSQLGTLACSPWLTER